MVCKAVIDDKEGEGLKLVLSAKKKDTLRKTVLMRSVRMLEITEKVTWSASDVERPVT